MYTPEVALYETKVTPAGSKSVSDTAVAFVGPPLLVTTRRYLIVSPSLGFDAEIPATFTAKTVFTVTKLASLIGVTKACA